MKMCESTIVFKVFFLNLVFFHISLSTLMDSQGIGDTFRQCLAAYHPQNDLRRCFGIGTISRLQILDSSPEFDIIDGLTFSKDPTQELREDSYNYAEQNPADFRSIIDTFEHVFSKRAMRWDMNFIYPGLAMRIFPAVSPGGFLEFYLDPNQETINGQHFKEFGTGRLLARQFLVPLLLGFKFNIASIVPIIFGVLVLLAKKLVFVSKIALILSSAFGLGSLLFNYGGNNQNGYVPSHNNYYQTSQHHPTTFGQYYKNNEEYPSQSVLQYRGVETAPQDEINLYENRELNGQLNEDGKIRKGRNFAWNDDEKIKLKKEN
ncbi:hypothetical protein ABEB36_010195 [Hypothenemus hampei]|uniref:Osiris 10 n=1 Tax=Hypothenemus hampei TaxID=57062 RepID=A0ABD1EIU2_HYPHA